MPAEWEKHDAIWLSWPHDIDSFPDLAGAEKAYVAIIKAIHLSESVNLLVLNKKMQLKITKLLQQEQVDLKRVYFFVQDYADVWLRDYGPIFVLHKQTRTLAMTNWIFNAWGNKYDELLKDNNIPLALNRILNLPIVHPDLVLEGGSIEVNGRGTLLTTQQCLLNKNRNHYLNHVQIEQYLKKYLGITKIIWLREGIVGDDTDGHIDDLARFVNPTTILYCFEDDPHDENYRYLSENYELLKKARDQDGKKFMLVKLPMPGIVRHILTGKRLPASYANFYIGNTVVLVPVFGHKNDQTALAIIQAQFPQRKVIDINATALVHGLGTLHCMSQQQPKSP
ncbi:agmatine deiminase family protein [Candidatus Woesearchaeota archaeon]|nr:agmatine deiminase family protein [Candidatus Woesearchaeota archaeon]